MPWTTVRDRNPREHRGCSVAADESPPRPPLRRAPRGPCQALAGPLGSSACFQSSGCPEWVFVLCPRSWLGRALIEILGRDVSSGPRHAGHGAHLGGGKSSLCHPSAPLLGVSWHLDERRCPAPLRMGPSQGYGDGSASSLPHSLSHCLLATLPSEMTMLTCQEANRMGPPCASGIVLRVLSHLIKPPQQSCKIHHLIPIFQVRKVRDVRYPALTILTTDW